MTESKGTIWRLTRSDLDSWVDGLVRSGKRVFAPLRTGDLWRFRTVGGEGSVAFPPGKTTWSPKEILFPRTEPLFHYRVDGGETTLSDPPLPPAEQVLIGVRPCDAAGLARLGAVLSTDPFFAYRRERTTIVALACSQAEPECFCTAVGGGPAGEEGADLLLVRTEDGFLARPVTAKGAALAAAASWQPASAADWDLGLEAAKRVADQIRRAPIAPEWAATLEERFEDPAWTALSERCVGCSICTYVCPSCSCFTVDDEGSASCGTRCRSWDSCSFGLFTLHGSGHNPRATQAARFRQRVLHKFAYFRAQQNGGPSMCVGCGRCIALCPVTIDIHEAVHAVMTGRREAIDVGP
jgi:ferredoxin